MQSTPRSPRRRCLEAGALSIAACLSGTASAADTELLDILLKNGAISKSQYGALSKQGGELASADLLDILSKNGAITRDQYTRLSRKPAYASTAQADDIQAVEARLTKKIDDVANKPKDPKAAGVKIDGKGIRFETNDGNFKFFLNGRLHTDANVNSGGDITTFEDKNHNGVIDPKELDSVENNRLTDGTEIRRFRMEFAATFFHDWQMKMQPEFANSGGNGTVGLRDAFIKYTGWEYGDWTVGQSKQPFSFQQMMSSNDMVFMERSLEYEMTNRSVNRAVGLRYDIGDKNWGFATGFYGDTATRQSSGTTAAKDEGWGFSARATVAPLLTKEDVIHVGVSGAYREPRDGDKTVRYSIAPSAIDHVTYLDTGSMKGVDSTAFFNAEALGIYGPFSLEAEYNAGWINRDDQYDNGFLDGWHVDLAYSLTGESRAEHYDGKQGVVRRITPARNFDLSGGWGAWELKARTMYVNMNSIGQFDQGGGRELASTFGFNWYWNQWARFMVDWTHVWDLDVGTEQASRTVAPIPGNSPSGWDQVSARVSLAY